MYSIAVFLLLTVASCLLIFAKRPSTVLKVKTLEDVSRIYTENKRMGLTGKKLGRWEKFKANSTAALEHSNLSFNQYLYIMVGLGLGGLIVGLIMNNVFLALVLALGLPVIPGWILNIKTTRYKQWLSEQIETVLGIITNTYMSTDSITAAINKNLPNIEMPLRKVFQDFVTSKTFIDSSDVRNIRRMQESIDNAFWREWCDVLILCQHDRLHKQSLTPIVKKMADVRQINEELATETAMLYKDFFSVEAVVLANIPMLRFLNKDWYDILTTTVGGQLLIAVTVLAAIIGTAYVIKINKPANLS